METVQMMNTAPIETKPAPEADIETDKADLNSMSRVDLIKLVEQYQQAQHNYENSMTELKQKQENELRDMNNYYMQKVNEKNSILGYYERKLNILKEIIEIETGGVKHD